ncbi:MAG: 5-oxoprolinase subunit PxpB [Psychroserpens sp.]|nr:5-oxoprolinase subunit PxpB [Psychroserpens sp.]
MTNFDLKYHHYSERAILIKWPMKISENILKDIILFKNHLKNSSIKSILEINTSYNSILISYIYAIDNFYDKKRALNQHYLDRNSNLVSQYRQWKIPVCYDEEFGIDLKDISQNLSLSKTEIIGLHSSSIYTVFFIGFLPGFLYLGGLDKKLFHPRKKAPRTSIKKGAVGIGNQQTGIYPNSSPGGWQIIGNSPLEFFDTSKNEPCFAKPGDKIEFTPISKSEHSIIKNQLISGNYKIESEVIHG